MRRTLIVLAVVPMLAACGGDGGNRLSKTDYAARANAICARFNRQVTSFGGATTMHDLAQLSARTLPALDTATRRLRKLRPPKDEDAAARRWLSSMEQLHADVARIRDRAVANDLRGVQRLIPGATRDNRLSDRLANGLGATTCAQTQR
jgi:hypothetical protein